MLRKNQHVKCAQILSKSPKSQKEPKDSELIKEAKKVIEPKWPIMVKKAKKNAEVPKVTK